MALYPESPQALEATRLMNANGDFTYRPQLLGSRWMVLKTPQYDAGRCRPRDPEGTVDLHALGMRVSPHLPGMVLHIVGYVDGNARLARCRVRQIKNYLVQSFPELPADQIRLSWFGVPERVPVGNGTRELKTSINIFTMPVKLNSI